MLPFWQDEIYFKGKELSEKSEKRKRVECVFAVR